MRLHVLSFAMAATALALAPGCKNDQIPPCPGVQVGDFLLTAIAPAGGVPPDPSQSCGTVDGGFPPSPSPVRATLAWDPAGDAVALCLDRPDAPPLLGKHDGDSFKVTSDPESQSLDLPCGTGCSVNLQEEVTGTVLRDGSGAAVGIDGGMTEKLTEVSSCTPGRSPDGGTTQCPGQCEIDYQLQGVP